jgi:RNA polymerase sigma-70 factor (ECF subfamily)
VDTTGKLRIVARERWEESPLLPTPLPFRGGDEDLIEALRMGHPGAAAVFYERHADEVGRVLVRILGSVEGLPTLIERTMVAAIRIAAGLNDPTRLPAVVVAAAVATARRVLRRERRARYLGGLGRGGLGGDRPDRGDATFDAARAFYAALDALSVDERVALALHVVDGMSVADIAAASGISLPRTRRRIRRAGTRLVAAAEAVPVLRCWLDRGGPWSLPTVD